METKEKAWWWKLTFPFAHNNYTTIGRTIYFPKGFPPTVDVVRHEAIHSFQQSSVGVIKFLLLYLFMFPLFWNPWRWRWEMEAYIYGSQVSPEIAAQLLKSASYGWLFFHGTKKL